MSAARGPGGFRPSVGAALACALLAWACGAEPEAPPPPAFELRPVVATAVAELEAELVPPPAPAPQEAEAEELLEQVRGLVHFVTSSTGGLQASAFEEMAGLGDPAVPLLSAILSEPDRPDTERTAALDLLAVIDTELSSAHLVSQLERALEPWVRARCAWQLGRGTQDWFTPRLVFRLKYETDHDAAVWIADALVNLGNFSGIDALSNVAASGKDPAVRALAAGRLEAFVTERNLPTPAEVRDIWYQGDPEARLPRVQRSARWRLEVWRWVARLDEFQLRGVDDARFVLSRLAAPAAEILASALHDESAYVRLHSAQSLQRMGPRGAVAGPELVNALTRSDLAPAAAQALGLIVYKPAETPLLARLAPGNDPDVRWAATKALGYLGLPSSIPALRSIVAGQEPLDLRQTAAESLVFAGAPELALSFLLDLFHMPGADPASSEAAVGWWLRQLAGKSPAAADLLERWNQLEPPSGAIEPVERTQARLRAREAMVRAALDELLRVASGS